ncbi:MAG: methylenetetrahydrofolate reductase [Desulfobacca sp.]|uniref:methylenetetrahydrofolate reductase n=1 Tax=Desulfobacca sp. TaxID=2067990 RepID=UPI00404AE144
MSKLQEALEGGKFPIVVEIKPPKGINVEAMLAPLKSLNGRVTTFSIPDNEHAKMRLSPVAAAQLVQAAGGEPMIHLTCRDRNRLALESELLGAAALGVENVLIVSGDFVNQGDHPDAKPVYDADSVQLLQIAKGMMTGYDSAGQELNGKPQYYLGAVAIPEADPLGPQLLKVKKKTTAGVDFFITAPVYDLQKLQEFRQQLGAEVKMLATVKVPKAAEVEQALEGKLRKVYSLPVAVAQELKADDPAEVERKGAALAAKLLKEIKSRKLADGVYLKARGKGELVAAILDQAGV